jgi:hypothetical protein
MKRRVQHPLCRPLQRQNLCKGNADGVGVVGRRGIEGNSAESSVNSGDVDTSFD